VRAALAFLLGAFPDLAAFLSPSVAPRFGWRTPMSRVSWPTFQDRQPRAHLVVGWPQPSARIQQ
jgi:hypothetical protein